MKTTLPDHIDLGPFRYEVTVDELSRLRAQEVVQAIVLGRTDHDKLTVILNETMPVGLARETLVHEALHIVTEVCGLRAKWGNAKDERIIRRLSPMLLELLRRNPDLVRYVTADEP